MIITESPIVYGLLMFIWIRDSWGMYVTFRQWDLVYQTVTVPDELDGSYPDENFSKARLYTLDMLISSMVQILMWDIIYTVVLLFEVVILLWTLSNSFVELFGFESSGIFANIIFVIIALLLGALIMVPLMVSQLTLEKRYGIDLQTLEDHSLKLGAITLLNLLLICAFVLGGHLILELILADLLEIYNTLVQYLLAISYSLIVVIIAMKFLIPPIITLIVGPLRPLPDGNLRQKIYDLITDVGFPLEEIYVCEASKTTIRSNAFTYGNKIIIYDTLILQISTDEVIAVLAHELGHWKDRHRYMKIGFSLLIYVGIRIILIIFVTQGRFYAAFSVPDSQPLVLCVIFEWYFIYIPLDYVCNFLIALLSKQLESQADAFATELDLGDYLHSALIKLYSNNLVFPLEDWLYQIFYLDRPGLLNRLENLS